MARLSDIIESFIKQMLDEKNSSIEIQRNELANQFNCVPSQINYVIDTRFTSEKGYYVESRRGGGGHIRIKRVTISTSSGYLMHAVNSIGESITQQSAEAFIDNFLDYDLIAKRDVLLLKAATSDKVLGLDITNKDKLRSRILKNMITSLLAGN